MSRRAGVYTFLQFWSRVVLFCIVTWVIAVFLIVGAATVLSTAARVLFA